MIDQQLCWGPGLCVPLVQMQLGLEAPEGSLTPTETCGCIAARQGPQGLAQCRAGSSESTLVRVSSPAVKAVAGQLASGC